MAPVGDQRAWDDYEFLSDYADEALRAAISGRRDRWAQAHQRLLSVPLEWRKPLVDAVHNSGWIQVRGRGGSMERRHAGDPNIGLEEIIKNFHGPRCYRPPR